MTIRTPTPPAWLTPPQIARELAIRESKIAAWIRSGELTACNIAEHVGGKPRWRIRRTDLEAFLLRRQSQAPVVPIRRRRKPDPDTIQFF
ncbi:MAG: helix-turn-helix domain-containing protein [Planctomycetota bacterium]|nr:helix-turn-helix domain-containing protein [Planctomycetota bacterium]